MCGTRQTDKSIDKQVYK